MSIVNINFNSRQTLFHINRVESNISASIARLSSGLRIASAADDPSGLANSNFFKAQISGLHEATRNAEDARNLVDTASSVFGDIQDILNEMRSLALETMSTATITQTQIDLNEIEYDALRAEIFNKMQAVTFNGIHILDQDGQPAQIGADNDSAHVLSVGLDTALRAEFTALGVLLDNTQLSGDAVNSAAGHAASSLLAVSSITFTSSKIQTSLGVQEYRLDSIIDDLTAQEYYTTAAKSNIMDADLASEISHFARLQIISQAGTAILAQAGSIDQRIIGILENL